MRVPLRLAARVLRPRARRRRRSSERLTMTGTEVERVQHHGVDALEHFVVGRVLEAEQHPDADRLTRLHGRRRRRRRRADRLRRAERRRGPDRRGRAAGRGDARRHEAQEGQAARRRVRRDDPGRGRARRSAPTTPGSWCSTTRSRPGTPLADVLPIADRRARARDHAQPARLPGRLRRRARGPRRHRRAAGARRRGRSDPGTPGRRSPGVAVEVEDPTCARASPRALFEDVTIGPSPPWLKARLMAAGPAPDQQRRRHHQLRDAADRPAAARVRPRPRRRRHARRAPRARRRARSTTLDGVERTLDADDGRDRRRRRARPRSPASWAATRSEVARRHHARADGGRRPGTGRTSSAPRRSSALRTRGLGRFEKGLSPEQALEAQAVAAQLMLELSGARLVPRHDRRRRRRARRRGRSALRDARVERAARHARSRATRSAEILEALGLRRRGAPTTGSTSPCPHWRRNDVTREADLDRGGRAASTGSRSCRPRCPSRRGARGRLDAASSGCAAGPRTRWSAPGCTRSSAGASPRPSCVDRLRLPADDPRARVVRLANPMSEDQSVLRTTLLGSLLDAAQRNRARGHERRAAVRVGARLPAHERRSTARATAAAAQRRLPLPTSATTSARCSPARLRPATWREPEPPRGRLLRRQGRARGACSTRCASPWTVEPAARAVPASRPRRARCSPAASRAGWLGELHPLVARALGPRAGARRFELDLDVLAAHAGAPPAYEDLTAFPAVREDLAVVVRRRRRRPRSVARGGARGGRRAARGAPRSSTSTAARRWGRARASLALRLEFRAPDRTLTDEDVAARARDRSSPRSRERARRRAPWLSVAVLGAVGLRRRARRARCLHRHPSSSSSRVTARSGRRARGSTTSTRATACRWCSRSSTSSATARSTPRSSPTRTAPPRRWSPRCASAACASSTSRADFRLRDLDDLRGVVRRARRARAVRRRRLRAARAATATQIARRRPRRQPRLLPDRRAARRWRRWRARALIADVVDRRQVGRLAAPAARRRTTTHFVVGRRERQRPTGRRATATRPRSSRSSRAGRDAARSRSRRTWSRSTRASWSPATSRRARAERRTSCAALYADAYEDEPFVELADAAARRARRARDELLPHLASTRDERTGRVLVFAAIDNLWKGAASQAVQNLNLMFGPARDGGARCERVLRLALGRACPTHVTERRAAACRQGFRAAGVAGRASSPAARPTSACSSATRPTTTSAARFTRSGVLAAPVLRHQRALRGSTRCAPWSPTPATPTPPPARRGLDDAAQDAGRGRDGRRRATEDQVAVASTGVIGVPLDADAIISGHRSRARGELRRRRRRGVRRGDPHHRRVRQARARSRSRCRRAPSGSPPRPRARG